MHEHLGTALRVWYAFCGTVVTQVIITQKRHSLPLMPNMVKMLRPAIASHKKPKNTVIGLELL